MDETYDASPLAVDEGEIKQSAPANYWAGPGVHERWFFPDGEQWIDFSKLTHGERTLYSAKTNREMIIERQSGDARMKADLMGDTNILMDIAIKDWYVLRDGKPVPFSKGTPGSNLAQFLAQADPELIDDLERAIRSKNAWLLGEQSAEDIQKQITQLEKDLIVAQAREAGK
jgi:hypothetical protein